MNQPTDYEQDVGPCVCDDLAGGNMRSALHPGEREAIKAVLNAGRSFGFGNMIAHLQTEWARRLMKDYGLDEKAARLASGGDGYPFEWDFGLDDA